MKLSSTTVLACALATAMFAQDAAKSAAKKDVPAAATMTASAAVVTAPLVLKDGAIGQPLQTELAEGGKAVFSFTLEKAGDYEIYGAVNANAEDANSFYLNVDAAPTDTLMIWDIDVTSGFEERVVSWRGKGDADGDEFKPKRFTLTAGAHKIFVVGREPALLKSLSVRAVKK